MKIKRLYEAYKQAQTEMDRIEAEMDDALENGTADEMERAEDAFDTYYAGTYFPAYKALSEEVVKLTGVEASTARAMIANPRFDDLLSRLA